MTKDPDNKETGSGSSAGGGAPSQSPPAQGGGKKKKADPKVDAVFLKRHTLAGPDYPGGCHTFLPAREEPYREHRGGPLKKRTIPGDRCRLNPDLFKHLEKKGTVAKAGGDA